MRVCWVPGSGLMLNLSQCSVLQQFMPLLFHMACVYLLWSGKGVGSVKKDCLNSQCKKFSCQANISTYRTNVSANISTYQTDLSGNISAYQKNVLANISTYKNVSANVTYQTNVSTNISIYTNVSATI